MVVDLRYTLVDKLQISTVEEEHTIQMETSSEKKIIMLPDLRRSSVWQTYRQDIAHQYDQVTRAGV